MAPDIIERLKASAYHQLCLALLPFTHAGSESINADINSNFLQLGRRSGGRPQRTVYPRRIPVNTVIHTTLVGLEPTAFRLLVRRAASSLKGYMQYHILVINNTYDNLRGAVTRRKSLQGPYQLYLAISRKRQRLPLSVGRLSAAGMAFEGHSRSVVITYIIYTYIQTLRCISTGSTSSQFCSKGVRLGPSPRPWPNALMSWTPGVCVKFCQYHTPGILQMRQFGASTAVRQSLKG